MRPEPQIVATLWDIVQLRRLGHLSAAAQIRAPEWVLRPMRLVTPPAAEVLAIISMTTAYRECHLDWAGATNLLLGINSTHCNAAGATADSSMTSKAQVMPMHMRLT